ncbi:MAG: succinate dehydrogenase, cytochrome b556 subunit [Woeseia sp.]|nr:succinate dehydrogenase, cytochrome b556 subunit [Woeseia sp.]MBT8096470.1 succinate dehydrogenase, cytochrome b556 subunit [Woeseia sp.]NNE60806.1 succinate dehydrogenase, cytochrome b556 subunit [Woeseia sp.]NNL54958.1 succinate dehydrogenase, cytochrome b556 subunit [Woeseia sp.]
MTSPGRPLSPHLSIYRWPITMTLSILHRTSGIAMAVGLIAFAWWLLALASGAAEFRQFADLAASLPGQVALMGWLAAFFYHLANGIRHLVWDLGYGFELATANASAWFVLILTVVLTAGYWVLL